MTMFSDGSHWQGSPNFAEYAKHSPTVSLKATEGVGYPPDWYRAQSVRAKAAGLVVGAYHYLLRGSGTAQCADFLRVAGAADWFAVDVEGPDPKKVAGSLASASTGEIVGIVRDFAAAFHKAKPGQPLLMYGRALLRDRGIKDRMGCDLLWAPRYNGSTPVRANLGSCLDYGWPDELVAAWQFTGDGMGPPPHSLPGFPPDSDVSLLFLPLERLTGTKGEDVSKEMDDLLAGIARRRNKQGPPAAGAGEYVKKGFELADDIYDRIAASGSGGGGGGPVPDHTHEPGKVKR